MFIVESDNFFFILYRSETLLSERVKSGVSRLGSVTYTVEVLFASVAVIDSCDLVYVLSDPLEIATLLVN